MGKYGKWGCPNTGYTISLYGSIWYTWWFTPWQVDEKPSKKSAWTRPTFRTCNQVFNTLTAPLVSLFDYRISGWRIQLLLVGTLFCLTTTDRSLWILSLGWPLVFFCFRSKLANWFQGSCSKASCDDDPKCTIFLDVMNTIKSSNTFQSRHNQFQLGCRGCSCCLADQSNQNWCIKNDELATSLPGGLYKIVHIYYSSSTISGIA
jgi:hypothetical protein